MDLAAVGALVGEASGIDFVKAIQAAKSGDLFQILRYDVEPALDIAGALDPELRAPMIVAKVAIELLIAAKKTGLLDELISNMPRFEMPQIASADAQQPAMQKASGNENPQI